MIELRPLKTTLCDTLVPANGVEGPFFVECVGVGYFCLVKLNGCDVFLCAAKGLISTAVLAVGCLCWFVLLSVKGCFRAVAMLAAGLGFADVVA